MVNTRTSGVEPETPSTEGRGAGTRPPSYLSHTSENSTVIIAILTSCWYYSSSITAISTQLILNKQKQDDGEVILAALVLTSLQLLIGSAVGKLTLHFVYYDHSPSSPIKGGDHQSQKQYPLGLLHGLGCICTNFGFGFGSASLVQIVKLLEPIETLILV